MVIHLQTSGVRGVDVAVFRSVCGQSHNVKRYSRVMERFLLYSHSATAVTNVRKVSQNIEFLNINATLYEMFII